MCDSHCPPQTCPPQTCHSHPHVTELVLPPAYNDGSTYQHIAYDPHCQTHVEHVTHQMPYCHTPCDSPIGGMRATPGVYIEQPFKAPFVFPPKGTSSWGTLETTDPIRIVCVNAQTIAHPVSSHPFGAGVYDSNYPDPDTLVYEKAVGISALRDDVELVRVLRAVPTSETDPFAPVSTLYEYMFVEKADTDPVIVTGILPAAPIETTNVADLTSTGLLLGIQHTTSLTEYHLVGRFLPAYQLTGGFFDNLTSKSERGWGYSVSPGAICLAPDLFKGPNICFVIGGQSIDSQYAMRTLRVIGTPVTSTLDVEVVDIIAGDDEAPIVTGKVGRDLELGAVQPPFVVRVRNVPVDAAYGFQGVSVSYTAYS